MNTPNIRGEIAASETATSPVAAVATVYQAPAIESVVTFEDLQREVFYAGSGDPVSPPVEPPVPL